MLEADSLRITAYLNAAYPTTALDEASVAVFSKELALLHDPVVAMEAAQSIVRHMTRFPSIADFRRVYKTINEHHNGKQAVKELVAVDNRERVPPPEWCCIWWWSTHYRDPKMTRVPAEMAGPGFEPLTIQEYAQLQTEWREAGSPLPGRLIPGMRRV